MSTINVRSFDVDPRFKDKNEYVRKKITILMDQFLVKPTHKELDHLYSLDTESEIDKACIGIIKRYWDDQDRGSDKKRRQKR